MMNKRALGATLLVAAALLQPSFANYADELNARFIRHKRLARRRLVSFTDQIQRGYKLKKTKRKLNRTPRDVPETTPTSKWKQINGKYYNVHESALSQLSENENQKMIRAVNKEIDHLKQAQRSKQTEIKDTLMKKTLTILKRLSKFPSDDELINMMCLRHGKLRTESFTFRYTGTHKDLRPLRGAYQFRINGRRNEFLYIRLPGRDNHGKEQLYKNNFSRAEVEEMIEHSHLKNSGGWWLSGKAEVKEHFNAYDIQSEQLSVISDEEIEAALSSSLDRYKYSYHKIKQLIWELNKEIRQTRNFRNRQIENRSGIKIDEMAEKHKVAVSELKILEKIREKKRKEMRDENLATLLRTTLPFNLEDALPQEGDKIRMIVDRPRDITPRKMFSMKDLKYIYIKRYYYKTNEFTVFKYPADTGSNNSYPNYTNYPTFSFSWFNRSGYDTVRAQAGEVGAYKHIQFELEPDARKLPYLSEKQVRQLKLRKVDKTRIPKKGEVPSYDIWVCPKVCGRDDVYKMY